MSFFFFNDTATTEIYTLSLHDALPISQPMMSTVSPAANRAFCTALTIVLMGSINVASSKLTLSGSATIPRSATHGIAFTYSPNPPPFGVNPAVNPVLLYNLHCENIRRPHKKHSPHGM